MFYTLHCARSAGPETVGRAGAETHKSWRGKKLFASDASKQFTMDHAIRQCLMPGDFIKCCTTSSSGSSHSTSTIEFGEVLENIPGGMIRCRMYYPTTAYFLRRFSIAPITVSTFPVAARALTGELYGTNTIKTFSLDFVADITFIVSIGELESGNVFVTGSSNLFFALFFLIEERIINYDSSPFFGSRYIQPFTMRLFTSLNMLANTIKKLMYHRPEAEDTRRSARFFLPK